MDRSVGQDGAGRPFVRLLLVTFQMDAASPVLGWQHAVATRLAARCERVVVLTERVGECHVPNNVEVHQVPRLCTTPLRTLGAKWLMNVPVWRWCQRHRFDAAFVHMNAEWTYRLAPCWRRFGLPVLLWYAHGTVSRRLLRAHAHATSVVTSSPEGFRIPSDKVRIIGQGIDTDLFTPPPSRPASATIVAVGRVSRRKSVALMLDAMSWLMAHASRHPFRLRVIGPTLTRDDRRYAAELQASIRERELDSTVTFEPARPMTQLPAIYGSAFLHLNLSQTGSIDKTILEALACGCPTLTSNEAAFSLLREFPELIMQQRTPGAIGRRICQLYEDGGAAPEALRGLVMGRHDLASYADRVMTVLTELTREAAA